MKNNRQAVDIDIIPQDTTERCGLCDDRLTGVDRMHAEFHSIVFTDRKHKLCKECFGELTGR